MFGNNNTDSLELQLLVNSSHNLTRSQIKYRKSWDSHNRFVHIWSDYNIYFHETSTKFVKAFISVLVCFASSH